MLLPCRDEVIDQLGGDQRHVTEKNDGRLRLGRQRCEPRLQRRRQTVGGSFVADEPDRKVLDGRFDLACPMTRDDDDRIGRGHGSRFDDMPDERLSLERRQKLRLRSEPAALPSREDDGGDLAHAEAPSRSRFRSFRIVATISARIETAISAGEIAPILMPIGA